VPRICPGVLFLALVTIAAPAPSAKSAGRSDTLLPTTTKGYFSIADTEQLAEHWNKTQLGQLAKDPVMEPFATDLKRQFEERLSRLQSRLGLTFDDLKGVPSGEISMAVLEPAPDQIAVVLLVEVAGHEAKAEALLKKVADNIVGRGGKRSETRVSGTAVVVFDLPPQKDEDPDAPPRKAAYFLKDGLLGASDKVEAIAEVLARLGGTAKGTLAELPAYRAVMDRCVEDAGDAAPQIRWFIEPFGYVRAVRAAVPEKDRPRGTRMIDHLAQVGFTAVQAAGGFVDLAVGRCEVLHRTMVYAPRPHEKSMKMLDFPNAELAAPPRWIPRDLASYTTVSCDLLEAFDHFGPLFDQVIGEGEEEGLWDDVLDTLENDPNGPQINLRDELFAQLGSQVIVITDYVKPISTTSERLLIAIETNDPKAVALAIEKNFQDDEEMQRRELAGHVVWEVVPKEVPAVQRITIDVPPIGLGAHDQRDEDEEEEEDRGGRLLPSAAVTVGHGYLLVASHYDFLAKILQPIEDERETLGRTIDYLVVDAAIKEAGGGLQCVRSFTRTDEAYRPTYELIRQGKMPESQMLLGRVLNTILAAAQADTLREQKIDGSKLPDFEVVRRSLGPAGLFGTTEDDGWFFKGFTLGRETE